MDENATPGAKVPSAGTLGGRPALLRFAAVPVLVAVTVAVYAPSLGNGFVWDDHEIIVSNPQTRDLSALPAVMLSVDETAPYYRPLARASYLLDYRLFGMNPSGFHAVSVLLHAAAVLALFWLAALLFESQPPAFLAALLFAVHPVNAEAVAFISGRNSLLATLFSLLSVALLIVAERRGSRRLCAGSALAFFVGLLSKETAIMALPFAAGWLWFFREDRERSRRSHLLFLAPHLLALAGYAALRVLALRSAPPAAFRDAPALAGRLLLNLYTVPRYLGLALFPGDLAIFHPVPSPWPVLSLVAAWVGIAAVVALVVASRSAAGLAGLAWLGLNLLPIANLLPIPATAPIAERYFYAPGVGLWIVLAEGARRIAARVGWRAVAGGVAALAVGLSVRTLRRIGDWRDDLSLAESAVRAEPSAPEAHFNLGVVLQAGRDLPGARREWEETLKIYPGHALAITAVAAADAAAGDVAKAEAGLRQALAIDPRIAIAHYDLARICDRSARPGEAVTEYRAFLRYTRTRGEAAFVARARARLGALESAPEGR